MRLIMFKYCFFLPKIGTSCGTGRSTFIVHATSTTSTRLGSSLPDGTSTFSLLTTRLQYQGVLLHLLDLVLVRVLLLVSRSKMYYRGSTHSLVRFNILPFLVYLRTR
eukprot:SAG11_NODE_5206_length_1630_cov_3.191378_1_plen_107_part_00